MTLLPSIVGENNSNENPNPANSLGERLENIDFSDNDVRILLTPSRPKVRP